MSNPSNTGSLPRSGGLSLYANLLDPTSTTISKPPVVFRTGETEDSQDSSAKKHQIVAGNTVHPKCLVLTDLDWHSCPTISTYQKTTTVTKTKTKGFITESSFFRCGS